MIVIDADLEGREQSRILKKEDVPEINLPEKDVLLPATYRSNAYMMRLIAQMITEKTAEASKNAALALQVMTDISVTYNMSGAYELLRMVTNHLSDIDVSAVASSIVESATAALNEIVSSTNQNYRMEKFETDAENTGYEDEFWLAA